MEHGGISVAFGFSDCSCYRNGSIIYLQFQKSMASIRKHAVSKNLIREDTVSSGYSYTIETDGCPLTNADFA